MRKNFLLFSCLLLLALPFGGGCTNEKHVRFVANEEQMEELREAGRQRIAQLREAAERGDVEAQYQIGYEYVRSLPMPVRYRTGPGLGFVWGEGIRGIRWYSKDTQQRFFFSIDREEGIKWLRKAAEQGHIEAQYQLGKAYAVNFNLHEDGTMEPIDHAEGFKWLHRAAEQGHVEAMFLIGMCHQHSWGVPEEMEVAIKWLRKAAERGHVGAANTLRRMEESTE